MPTGNSPYKITKGPNGRLAISGGEFGPTPVEMQPGDPRLFGQTARAAYARGETNDPGHFAEGDPRADTQAHTIPEGMVQVGQAGVGGWSEVIDPSLVQYDPKNGAYTPASNMKRPDPRGDKESGIAAAIIGSMIAGPAVGAAMGGGMAASGLGADAFAGATGEALGGMGAADAFAGGAAGGSLGTAGGLAQIPADLAMGGAAGGSIPLAEAPAILSASHVAGGAGVTGGLAGLGEAGGAGGIGSGADAFSGAQGGVSGSNGVIDGLTDSFTSPSSLARAGLGLASLGAASSGHGSGGNTDAASIIEQMARANRVNQSTPIGSRQWSQDPTTGQWSVADTMSAPEQANFTNVQGMNQDVTGMARQRLADLLANPRPKTRYDRPLGT